MVNSLNQNGDRVFFNAPPSKYIIGANGQPKNRRSKIIHFHCFACYLTMTNIGRTIMCSLLPLLFVTTGLMKLYPFFPTVYKEMVSKFKIYNGVFPTAWMGYPPDGDLYRIIVGSMEVSSALGVLVGPTGLKKVGCCILITIMIGAILTHLVLLEFLPSLVPAVYLMWTMYVLWATMQKEAKSVKVN
ncbi:uncharacterized protein LOC132553163 [Ylistrum balloti]|uniref:uncharacterized protein LOC132553163 n=1 Tax=Ylistrum balloti TaxID=509963 RepID=UPI002905DB95|nr:uncharacterized protein LOC132553163 [Ylistrum balloti]